VRALVAARSRVHEVEAVGRQIGRDLASPEDDRPPEEAMYSTLTAMGFQPRRELEPAGTLTYCLDNCPYRDAVRERQTIVCGLHRGITRGLLDAIDARTKLTGFVPKDPDAAGCLIQLRGPLADEAAARE
jgi:predicted ArsR family transcriptional regulator